MDERYPALLDPAIGPTILRRVVAATIYQAVLDGRASTARLDPNPGALKRNAAEALVFLNHQITAEIAAAFGVQLPDNITPESLRVMSRGVSRPRVRTKAVSS